MRAALAALFATLGGFTLAAQTALLREHLVAYGGNELGLGAFYGSWFLWIAVGALAVGGRRVRAWLTDRLPWLALSYLPALVAAFALMRSLRGLVGAAAFAEPPLGPLLLWTSLVNAPVGLVTGALVPVGVAAAARVAQGTAASGAVGPVVRFWALECLGAVVGGFATVVAVTGAGATVDLALGAGAALGAAVVWLGWASRARSAAGAAALLVVLALLTLATSPGRELRGSLEERRVQALLKGAELVASQDTHVQHAAVARRPGQVLLLLDGRVAAAYPPGERPLDVAALALGQVPAPRAALVVGSGAPAFGPSLLAGGAASVTTLAPDPDADALLHPHLPPEYGALFADPRFAALTGDPRRVLAAGAEGRGPFDLVILDLPDPATAQANRLRTVEFLRLVRRVMTPGGVVLTRFRAGQNILSPTTRSYGRSLFETVHSVFPDWAFVPGEETWLVAGAELGAVASDAAAMGTRHHSRGPAPYEQATYDSLVEPARQVESMKAFAGPEGPRGELNTDGRPIAFYLNLTAWAAAAEPATAAVLLVLRAAGGWLVAIPLGLLFLFGLRIPSRRRGTVDSGAAPETRRWGAAAAAAFGAGGMALQLVILLSLQSRCGDLYWLVGAVNAAFMLGLAAALELTRRRLARSAGPAPRALAAAGLVGAAFAVALPSLLAGATAELGGQSLHGLLSALAGAVGGVGLALSGALASGQARRPPPRQPDREGDVDVGAPSALGEAANDPGYEGNGERSKSHPHSPQPIAHGPVPGQRTAGELAGVLQLADHAGAAVGAVVTSLVLLPLLGREGACLAAGAGMAIPAGWILLTPVVVRAQRWVGAWSGNSRAVRLPPRPLASRTGWFLLWLALTSAAVAGIAQSELSRPDVRVSDHDARTLAGANRVESRVEPFPHHLGWEHGAAASGAAVATAAAADIEVDGWGGPMALAVAVDRVGVLRGVRVLDHRETPAYVERLADWLRRLEGLDVTRPLRLGEDVDGMTGASVTARAILGGARRTAATLAVEAFGVENVELEEGAAAGERMDARAWWSLLALLAAVPIARWARGWGRRAALAVTVALGGVVWNATLSTAQLVDLAMGHSPGAEPSAWVLLVGAVAVAALFGPLYCASVCPLGAAQELVGDLCRARAPRPGLFRWARALKYVVLGAVVLAAAMGQRALLTADPLQYAFAPLAAWPAGVWPVALLAGIVTASALFPRLWCRVLCPAGAALETLGALAPLRRLLPRRSPARCDLGVEQAGEWDCLECHRCRQ